MATRSGSFIGYPTDRMLVAFRDPADAARAASAVTALGVPSRDVTVLRGEEGDDVLDGGAGDDILIGSAGDDVLLNGEVVFDE